MRLRVEHIAFGEMGWAKDIGIDPQTGFDYYEVEWDDGKVFTVKKDIVKLRAFFHTGLLTAPIIINGGERL